MHVQDLWEKAKDAGDMGDQDAATRLANLCAASALPSAICGCCYKCYASRRMAQHALPLADAEREAVPALQAKKWEAIMLFGMLPDALAEPCDSSVPRLRVLALVLLPQTDLAVSRQGAPPREARGADDHHNQDCHGHHRWRPADHAHGPEGSAQLGRCQGVGSSDM